MPYISRNKQGEITELNASPPEHEHEWLDIGDPEIMEFLKQLQTSEQAKQVLSDSDSEMIRVIEDLIDLMITKNIIHFTDLPVAVQAKLGARKQIRREMNVLQNLVDDGDAIF